MPFKECGLTMKNVTESNTFALLCNLKKKKEKPLLLSNFLWMLVLKEKQILRGKNAELAVTCGALGHRGQGVREWEAGPSPATLEARATGKMCALIHTWPKCPPTFWTNRKKLVKALQFGKTSTNRTPALLIGLHTTVCLHKPAMLAAKWWESAGWKCCIKMIYHCDLSWLLRGFWCCVCVIPTWALVGSSGERRHTKGPPGKLSFLSLFFVSVPLSSFLPSLPSFLFSEVRFFNFESSPPSTFPLLQNEGWELVLRGKGLINLLFSHAKFLKMWLNPLTFRALGPHLVCPALVTSRLIYVSKTVGRKRKIYEVVGVKKKDYFKGCV